MSISPKAFSQDLGQKHVFTSNTPWVNKWSIELSGVIDCTHRAKEVFPALNSVSDRLARHKPTCPSFFYFPVSASVFSELLCWETFTSDSALRFQSQNASLWERANNVKHAVISQSFFVCIMIWFPLRSFQMALLFIYTYFIVLSCKLQLQRECNSVELFHASASPEKMLMCHQGG